MSLILRIFTYVIKGRRKEPTSERLKSARHPSPGLYVHGSQSHVSNPGAHNVRLRRLYVTRRDLHLDLLYFKAVDQVSSTLKSGRLERIFRLVSVC